MTINSLALPKLCEITNTSYQDFHRVYQGSKSIPFKNYTLSVDLKDLPSGYKTVEYLESTGTQWIDTGVKLSNESEVKCEFMEIVKAPNTSALYGNETNKNARFSAFFKIGASSTLSRWDFASEMVAYLKPLETLTKYKSVHNATGVSLNGLQIINFASAETFETGDSLTLFCIRRAYIPQARIYSFSISRAGALQLQFIPCIDNLGNPCMFDAVSKQTFRNQDNIDPESDFLYPSSESSTYSLRREIPAYGRMTEHGIQKLYHLPEDYEGEAEDFIKENNFKELVYTEKPNDGKNYIFHWKETDTQLIVVWAEAEKEELEYV